jgi:hypothetical protein
MTDGTRKCAIFVPRSRIYEWSKGMGLASRLGRMERMDVFLTEV